MTTVETHPLAELTVLSRQVASALRAVGDDLARSSVDSLIASEPMIRERLLVGRLAFEWSLSIGRQRQKVVFFFRRRRGPLEVVAATKLVMEIESAPSESAVQAEFEGPTRYAFLTPDFVIPRPTEAQLRKYAPDAEATRRNTLLLRSGPAGSNRLGVTNPGRQTARIKYSTEKGSTVFDGLGKWPIGIFLELVEALREWVTGRGDDGDEVPFDPRHGPNTDVDDFVRQIGDSHRATLEWLVTGGAAHTPERPTLYQLLRTEFAVTGYRAEINLRLRPNGNLAEKNTDDHFTLRLGLRVEPRPPGVVVKARVGVPDFLVGGEFQASLLEAVSAEGPVHTLNDKLSGGEFKAIYLADAVNPKALAEFIMHRSSRPTVFRTRRKGKLGSDKVDTDVFVLHGELNGSRRVLVFSARLKLTRDPEAPAGAPRRVEEVKQVDPLFYGPADDSAAGLDRPTSRHLLRILGSIQRWIGVLR